MKKGRFSFSFRLENSWKTLSMFPNFFCNYDFLQFCHVLLRAKYLLHIAKFGFLVQIFNMLFFNAFENNPCTKWFVAKRLGSAIFYYFFIIFTFRKWYIAKSLHCIITTKWIIPSRTLSLQKDVQIVQN